MATKVEQQAQLPSVEFIGVVHEGVPVATANLEACVRFYMDVLGLKKLPRPKALDDLGPGAWLGDEHDRVQFHLIATENDLIPGPDAEMRPTGRHTAWRVGDINAFRERMRALGIPFREIGSLIGEPQLFVKDPEGHTWEFQGTPKQR